MDASSNKLIEDTDDREVGILLFLAIDIIRGAVSLHFEPIDVKFPCWVTILFIPSILQRGRFRTAAAGSGARPTGCTS